RMAPTTGQFATRLAGSGYAREGNSSPRTPRQASGQGAQHAGRRVRPRRNSPRPRRKARRTLHETGDCDWTVEGPAIGRRPAGAAPRTNLYEAKRRQRATRGSAPVESEDIAAAFARDASCAEARTAAHGIE